MRFYTFIYLIRSSFMKIWFLETENFTNVLGLKEVGDFEALIFFWKPQCKINFIRSTMQPILVAVIGCNLHNGHRKHQACHPH